jgi:hypothetical protein
MAQQIALETFTTALLTLFEETFERVHGAYLDRGTSLFETLETVSAAEASRPVSAICASIAAQVNHVCFYLEPLGRFVRGEEVGSLDWQASWRVPPVTPAEWEALKERLRQAHRDLLALANDPATWQHENAIGGALATLAHTAYHLGEIRQALCTVRHASAGGSPE